MAQTIHQGLRKLYPNITSRRNTTGAFSVVYADPKHKDRVIKVTADSAYMRYIKWCRKQAGNPFVPIVHSIKQMEVQWSGRVRKVYVVNIEKLHHIPSNRVHKLVQAIHKDGAQHLSTAGHQYPDTILFKDWKKLAKTTTNPHLQKVLKYITVANAEIDLHEGNIMVRPSSNHYVFTDPLVGGI